MISQRECHLVIHRCKTKAKQNKHNPGEVWRVGLRPLRRGDSPPLGSQSHRARQRLWPLFWSSDKQPCVLLCLSVSHVYEKAASFSLKSQPGHLPRKIFPGHSAWSPCLPRHTLTYSLFYSDLYMKGTNKAKPPEVSKQSTRVVRFLLLPYKPSRAGLTQCCVRGA